MARRGYRDTAVAGQVRRPYLLPRLHDLRRACRNGGRVGDRLVVAVLQPSALVRTPGRYCSDDRRVVCYVTTHRQVDREGRDGDVVPLPGDPGTGPGLRRVGRGHPLSLGWCSACDDGGDHPAGVRNVDARPDGWLYRELQE